MRRSLASLCAAACLLALPGSAPAEAPAVSSATTAAAVRPALWKVSDADTTIWLFGTIHILPQDVDWYKGPVRAALEGSGELVTEIPIDETQQSAAVIVAKSRRGDGKSLRDALPPVERTKYEAGMTALGLPVGLFDGNDTWFAALMMTMIPLKLAGYSTESGIDEQVAAKARARHMTNTALESAAFQIDLFENLPEPTQQAYLAEVVETLPTVKTDIDEMVGAWKQGDPERLARLLNEDESDPQMRRVLITDRNATWARWLKARLDRPGTVFVAVGAGHLAGEDSVQDMLAKAGVRTKRVQ